MVKSSGGLFPALEKKSTLKSSPSSKLRQQKRTDYRAEERLTQLSTVYLLEEIFIEKIKGPTSPFDNKFICFCLYL
jgi:hypothetical protein